MQHFLPPVPKYLVIIGVLICILDGCTSKETKPVEGLKVPEGFSIENAADSGLVSYPIFAGFDNNGRLFTYESNGTTTSTEDVLKNPIFQIRILEDENGDGIFDKSTVFADNIPYAMGGAFYNGSLYVAAPPDLIRFKDTNDDGVADEREVILSGWTLNHNAATLSGPYMGPDGWLYLTDARRGFDIVTKEGDTLKGKGARIWRCLPDGSKLESIAGGGFDNSIELAFMPSGETIGTMTYFTDPQGGFRDALMHWVEGGVYPKPNQVIEDDKLILTGDLMPVMTKMARIAPSGLMRYRDNAMGETYRDNLFSAQFNTGKIMRHIVLANGATYTTQDASFMESDNSDVHPTDVLQDADGSLLVINTGGWFIAGCPLSVVAKTDVKGAIYRIRKDKAPKTNDPWGRNIEYAKLDNTDLIHYLSDQRFPVRDKAVEEIIQRKDSIVKDLAKAVPQIKDNEYRAAAIFAAYRIGTSQALQIVRNALEDSSSVIRVAAARALGMAKDKSSVNKLSRLVVNDKAPVKRQSAIALEQIGDTAAVPALINAAANANDRFVEHTVIHALITLKNSKQLEAALQHPSPAIRRASLIALDQMQGNPLQKSQVYPFLFGKDSVHKETGIWVTMHHPQWGDLVAAFLKTALTQTDFSKQEHKSINNLMSRFSNDSRVQGLITSALLQRESIHKKIFLLDVMAGSPVKNFPDDWLQLLKKMLLDDSNIELQSRILNLVQLRDIKSFDKILEDIANNTKMDQSFRLKALGVIINKNKILPDNQFKILVQSTDASNKSIVRQQAARILSNANLSNAQLNVLAKDILPVADAYLVPELVMSFKSDSSENTGLAMIASLKKIQTKLDNLPLKDFEKFITNYPANVQTQAQALIAFLKEQQKERIQQLERLASSLQKGDVDEGRRLFFGKATCFTCHAIENEGGDFGPDLTNIGEIRARHDILEAIVYPGVSFAREYETVKITTRGNVFTGIITAQTTDAITISTGPGAKTQIQRSDIVAMEQENTSMMPSGLNKILTAEELSNLVAYLESLPDGLGAIKKH